MLKKLASKKKNARNKKLSWPKSAGKKRLHAKYRLRRMQKRPPRKQLKKRQNLLKEKRSSK